MAVLGDECDKVQIKGVMVYVPLHLAAREGGGRRERRKSENEMREGGKTKGIRRKGRKRERESERKWMRERQGEGRGRKWELERLWG